MRRVIPPPAEALPAAARVADDLHVWSPAGVGRRQGRGSDAGRAGRLAAAPRRCGALDGSVGVAGGFA